MLIVVDCVLCVICEMNVLVDVCLMNIVVELSVRLVRIVLMLFDSVSNVLMIVSLVVVSVRLCGLCCVVMWFVSGVMIIVMRNIVQIVLILIVLKLNGVLVSCSLINVNVVICDVSMYVLIRNDVSSGLCVKSFWCGVVMLLLFGCVMLDFGKYVWIVRFVVRYRNVMKLSV